MKPNHSTPPELKPSLSLPLVLGMVLAGGIMLGVVFTQAVLTKPPQDSVAVHDEAFLQPPDPYTVPPPRVEDEEKPEIEDLQEQPLPPSIDFISDINDAVDVDGLYGGGYVLPDMDHGSLDEILDPDALTDAPRLVSWNPPVSPRPSIRGSVRARWVVEPDGTTSQIRILASSERDFENPVRRALRSARFEPGRKDGQAVRSWVEQVIQFK